MMIMVKPNTSLRDILPAHVIEKIETAQWSFFDLAIADQDGRTDHCCIVGAIMRANGAYVARPLALEAREYFENALGFDKALSVSAISLLRFFDEACGKDATISPPHYDWLDVDLSKLSLSPNIKKLESMHFDRSLYVKKAGIDAHP